MPNRPDRWNESMAFVYAIDGAAIAALQGCNDDCVIWLSLDN